MKRTVDVPALSSAPAALSFRRDLIRPPQAQVTQYENLVADRIGQLDAYAAQLGQGFGLSFTPGIQLNEAHTDRPNELLVMLFVSSQRVTLEKRDGRWGLYYTHEPGVIRTANMRTQPVPLKDAPLDVRERFLLHAEEFFALYLSMCEGRLASMKLAVEAGDRAIQAIQNLRLE